MAASVHLCPLPFVTQTYAEMDPTTAALEKEHEAVSRGRGPNRGHPLPAAPLAPTEPCPALHPHVAHRSPR